jgi:rare lipoprotein A (peptidoglycan hydrolase)
VIQGVIASLLFGMAPAYASPADATQPSRAEHRTSISQQRRTETELTGGNVTHARRPGRLRRNTRIASRQRNDQTPASETSAVVESAQDLAEGAVIGTGIASWYSADRYNKRTFSGVPFDENAMTAAHPWLPMGTRLRVTVQGGGPSVIVTINDRQGSKTRVIDLSKRAARELGILQRGIARVTLTQM